MFNKILPMTGVEPRTSGIESDRSTNWATTTSLVLPFWDVRSSLRYSLDRVDLFVHNYDL